MGTICQIQTTSMKAARKHRKTNLVKGSLRNEECQRFGFERTTRRPFRTPKGDREIGGDDRPIGL